MEAGFFYAQTQQLYWRGLSRQMCRKEVGSADINVGGVIGGAFSVL
jgi:hypothetical protein